MPARRRQPTVENDEKVERQGPPPNPTDALSAAMELMDDEFKDLKLEGKIATISGWLGRIPKNGWNSFNKYNYVLESDLVEHIRYYLAAARILIYQSVSRYEVVPTAKADGRSGDPRTDVLFEFVVVDGRSGEKFSFTMLGQGSDPRDKGSNKASTSAMKFAYMRLFNISSGEDAEADVKGDQDHAMSDGGNQPVQVTASTAEGAQRGGRQETATPTQIRTISNLSNQLNLGAQGLANVIERVLGDKLELPEVEAEQGRVIAAYLKAQKGEDAGKIVYTLQQALRPRPGDEGATDEPPDLANGPLGDQGYGG